MTTYTKSNMKNAYSRPGKGWAAALLAAACVFSGASAHAQLNQSYTPYEADASFNAYNSDFLVQSNGQTYYANTLSDRTPAFLWGQALDIVIAADAFERTHTTAQQQQVNALVTTFLANNPGSWSWDGWNDDIGWSVIACMRGYQATGNGAFLTAAANNWNMAYNRGWDNVVGGGIWENSDKQTKNPLSNDPFIIAGCALYAATQDSTYLTKSENIYAWVRGNIFDQTTGQVNGARTAAGVLQTSDNVYDSGCFIEAANCLHQVTGNAQYYNDAILAINHIVNEGPILHNNGEDSSNAWAYWFVKGLSDVCTDNNLWAQYYPWMLANANAAWGERNSSNITWNDWTSPTNLSNPAALTVSSAVGIWQTLNVPAQSIIVNENSGLAMDLIGGSAANNAPINQWSVSNYLDGAQHWMVIPTPGGHSAIISAATGMAASISAASKSNSAPLLDWPYSTSDASQQFDFVPEGNGWYDIKNVNSGLVLDDAGGGTANGTQIVQWPSGGAGAANQLWKFVPVVSFPGNYEIQSVSSGQALDVNGNSTANGASIIQWPYSGASNQLWNFTPTSRGYYRIKSVSSGQALNVTASSFFNGGSTVQWPAGGATNDQWFPALNSDGSFTFYNLNSGLVLDNPGGATQGAQFDQWITNGGSNQKFNLIQR
ncbi:hypothetical protein CCAX7_55950 [Capsulimonas corticalis]|uniref:Uncharacterized protein n=1 Tax=Capsulimonas corticalis TaxID=2219043 RepID=A0A402D0U3_9BACT|nr:RICIN domain-containing protein [Capsulimonas corticalis]BDI33544.1 hypothetical protein CCAX7_55950 [Capsulimonas corticalis]